MKKISWEVIHGKKLGRTIWYPTANIELRKWLLSDGVYNCNIVYNEEIYKWAWVYRESLELFEVYIFDFQKTIYWENIDIYVLEKLRENVKVNSLEEIKNLIDNDVKTISENHNYVLTFGTFDLVHKGHQYYLWEAKKYWDKLVTIIATDKNVEKFKWKLPINNQATRIADVKEMHLADLVTLWWETSHLDWLELYNPKIVCLGYDQVWFSQQLEEHIKTNNLNISVLRIPSYNPEIYKSSKLKKESE